MILLELMFEWWGTSLMYDFFASRRATRRVARYRRGATVRVPGRAGGTTPISPAITASPRTYFALRKGQMWLTSGLSADASRLSIALPDDRSQITFDLPAERPRRPWYANPVARYRTGKVEVELFCRPQDCALTFEILGHPR